MELSTLKELLEADEPQRTQESEEIKIGTFPVQKKGSPTKKPLAKKVTFPVEEIKTLTPGSAKLQA